MASKIKVDNINKVSDDSNIIKKCGTTTTIGSGASNPIVVDGSAVTIGRCGGTVSLASGATQTGFGASGAVNWDTSVKTSTVTAATGNGYFVNTTGGAVTVNLPAGAAGSIVAVADYTRTWETNNCVVTPNGSEKIGGIAAAAYLKVNGQSATFVYVDSTEGWINVQETQTSETGTVAAYVAASGGNTTATVGDYKVHTFTGPGTFTVSNAGNFLGSNTVDYLVIAGGAGAVGYRGGGGGAGGYRESVPSPAAWTASPLANPGGALPVSATGYPVAVGGGGAGSNPGGAQANGNDSVFHTITSAGGGKSPGTDGGSGGGSGSSTACTQGSGNTPPVSPPQGQDGGIGGTSSGGGGGGGAGAVGDNGTPANPGQGGDGGAGVTSNINNTPTQRAGGGGSGGADASGGSGTGGAGGAGGGGTGGTKLTCNATAGTANTGGGGGGGGENRCNGQAGGSGIVIIRYKFQ